MTSSLPPVDAEGKAIVAAQLGLCRQLIEDEGPLSFGRYMQQALYHPTWGYYRNGAIKFGAGGDFVTAPELSPLFSRTLAVQCDSILTEIPAGDVLEFGAGSGVMAAELLLELHRRQALPRRYYILELSADLQQRQRDCIAERAPMCVDRVTWLSTLPEQFSGVVLANEVLDAMPVTKFVYDHGQVYERGVDWQDDKLVWSDWLWQDAESRAKIQRLPLQQDRRYESELNLQLDAWMQGLASCLKQAVVLLIDYGYSAREYYHPDRDQGTIMCHYRQRAHSDPLWMPGVQDITAHVDFTAVANAACDAGMQVAGYTTQAAFLLNNGIMAFSPDSSVDQYRFAQALKQLTLPSEMGEAFKVIALSKGIDTVPQGCREHSQLHRL